jgi:seryl-tRNA synthetase
MSQPVDEKTPETNAGVTTEGTESQTGSAESQETKLSYEQLEAEVKRVRQEAAQRRIANRELEEKAKKWSEYEESQKTELQKLQDQLAERDRALAAKDSDIQRAKIAKQFNVADEDLDLLVGDEENMKRLAERLGKKEEGTGTGTPPSNLLAGNRGKPVGSNGGNFSMDDWIRGNR